MPRSEPGRFIDRSHELATLERRYQSDRAELLVLYGRRRVGKSTLLRQHCEGRPHLYFLAARVQPADSLRAFRELLAEHFADPIVSRIQLDSWQTALDTLADRLAGATRPLVVVLDELQYLCEVSPELPSVLQRWWDTRGRTLPLKLVLCGSHVSFMESEILAERSPLFGRRTGQLRLESLTPWDAAQFLDPWPAPELLRALAVAGGIPAYLERLDPTLDLRTNLERELLAADGYLFDEVSFLLRTELGQAHTYLSLLIAMASGATRLSEVASKARIAVTSTTKPLGVLRALGFVEREVPFTERNPLKSKKGIYTIRDPFTRFWCRYMFPHQSLIAAGRGEIVWQRFIEPYLPTYLGSVFEWVCREYVRFRVHERVPGEHAIRVGRTWDARHDLDVVAELTDGSLLVGECKAWQGPVGRNVLEKLRHRASAVLGEERRLRFALFSTGGFTDDVRFAAQDGTVLAVTLEDVLSPMTS